jgi:aspartate oxidase
MCTVRLSGPGAARLAVASPCLAIVTGKSVAQSVAEKSSDERHVADKLDGLLIATDPPSRMFLRCKLSKCHVHDRGISRTRPANEMFR